MPSIVIVLARMGHEVETYPKPVEELKGNGEHGQQLGIYLRKKKVDFVLSNLFVKEVAKVTNQLEVKYAVWCVDSPAYSTWVPESEYDNCYLFYFDYSEYEKKRQGGCGNVYHMPLAADIAWSEQLVITDEEIKKYGCDMSFVGGLYTRNKYGQMIELLPMELQEALTDIIEKSAFVWDGQDRLHMPSELVRKIKQKCPEIFKYP